MQMQIDISVVMCHPDVAQYYSAPELVHIFPYQTNNLKLYIPYEQDLVLVDLGNVFYKTAFLTPIF